MLQANATASALDLLTNGRPSAASGNASSKSDGFSQEFEKQVKNTSEKAAKGKSEASAQQAEPANEEKNRTDAQASEKATDAKGDDTEVKTGDGKEEADEEKGGKILPPGLSLEDAAEVEVEVVDIRQLLEAEHQAREDAGLPIPAMVVSAVEKGSGGKSVAKEEGMQQLLRDYMQQRRLAAGDGRAAEAGIKLVRAEPGFDLTAQLGASRSPTAGEALPATVSLSSASPGTAATAPPPAPLLPAHMTLGHPVQQKGWDQAMSQRVVWMVRNNMQEAQIQLNPRDLGPINVRIAVNQDQAHVQFVAQHATTREALENALPRLREMMQEAGLNLAQSDVSQHSAGRDGAEQRQQGASNMAGQPDEEMEADVDIHHHAYIAPGGVDYFA